MDFTAFNQYFYGDLKHFAGDFMEAKLVECSVEKTSWLLGTRPGKHTIETDGKMVIEIVDLPIKNSDFPYITDGNITIFNENINYFDWAMFYVANCKRLPGRVYLRAKRWHGIFPSNVLQGHLVGFHPTTRRGWVKSPKVPLRCSHQSIA